MAPDVCPARKKQAMLSLNGAVPKLGPPKTAASRRAVPLPEVVAAALAEHAARFPPGPGGLRFTSERGHPIRRNRFWEVWTRAVAAAGLPPGTRFHDLRHYDASLLIRHG